MPPLLQAEDVSRWRAFAEVRWGAAVAAVVLSLIGLATVHSASAEMAIDYLPRQAAWVGMGLLAFVLAFAFDDRFLLAIAPPLYLLAQVALILVFVFGHRAGGSQGWFRLGGVGMQPSELAKLATALMLARYLAGGSDRHLALRQIGGALAIVGLPMVLTVLQPDLGGAAMFVPIAAGMLFVAGVRWRLVAAVAVVGLLLGGAAWVFVMKPYQKQRVVSFLNPAGDPAGAGYQARQSKIAVGSGELHGRGYRQGSQSQLRFLPARHTDFILAVLAEEWGFLGVAIVLALYALFIRSAIAVAQRARDRAGTLLVVGLASGFAFHVLYNSAMVIGLVPITGIPLPFLSYGGSFMLVNWAAAGIILGVDFRRYVNR